MIEKVKLAEKLALFDEQWSPKVIGELNGQYVKVVKCQGEYPWHFHEHEDELFLVVKGRLDIRFRDRVVELNAGELCVVPRGVEHSPAAVEEAHVVLFEPAATRNTGNVDHEYTIEADALARI
jgi:mannose-6-phosphate isomerase-like protein (cupin superfamily)